MLLIYIYFDPAQALGGEFVPFDTLIEQSDYVIATCPLTEETKFMFNKNVFDKMKSSAIFINIGRGGWYIFSLFFYTFSEILLLFEFPRHF